MKHLAFLPLAYAAMAVQAAPFAITSTGTIDRSTFANIRNGERYAVTLVYDNGSSTAANQTWQKTDLRCAIWRMNNDASVVYTQTSFTGTTAAGSATTTDAGGLPAQTPDTLTHSAGAGDAYTASGIALSSSPAWQVFGNLQVGESDTFTAPDGRSFGRLQIADFGHFWRRALPVSDANAANPCGTPPLVMPGAPTNLRATPGNGQIAVRWDAPASSLNSPAPVYYTVHASYAGEPSAALDCSLEHPTTSCTLTGLSNGQTYTVTVHASTNGPGSSSPYALAYATPSDDPAPAAPTHITARPGNGQITVGWRAWQAGDGGTAPAYYHIVQEGRGRVCQVPHDAAPQCVVPDLINGQGYGFYVMAVSASDGASSPSAHAWATPGAVAPNPNPNPNPGGGNVQAVPALGLPGLALLGLGASALGGWRLRRLRRLAPSRTGIDG